MSVVACNAGTKKFRSVIKQIHVCYLDDPLESDTQSNGKVFFMII